ncbi:hypothetical protein HGM15179_018889 [Zosterops borbonicus]|uniref:Uncharacterized protein n=1 Tax=Zosterops borbonicus TaxID=364589 RepID=A0A8K1DBM3_9PASS|nr:hypothetical protein HGM15179_018889 [Zosterops borbonicus]
MPGSVLLDFWSLIEVLFKKIVLFCDLWAARTVCTQVLLGPGSSARLLLCNKVFTAIALTKNFQFVRKITLRKASISIKESEESCDFIRIKGESLLAHTHIPRVFTLEGLEGAAAFYPKLPATPCPLPFPIGGGTREVHPFRTACFVFPTMKLTFYPEIQNFKLVQTHLTVLEAKLSGISNKPAAQS